jgi:hypothetical protein
MGSARGGNPILEELESLLDPDLPPCFTLYVPDAWMLGLLKQGMLIGAKRVPESRTSLHVHLLDYDIVLRADSDPDGWAAELH